MMHDIYLVEVKTPSESKATWDYYKVWTYWMVQTSEVRVGHDAAKSLNSTQRWCVLVQRLPKDLPE